MIEYSFGMCTDYFEGECKGEILRTGFMEKKKLSIRFPYLESLSARGLVMMRNREGVT